MDGLVEKKKRERGKHLLMVGEGGVENLKVSSNAFLLWAKLNYTFLDVVHFWFLDQGKNNIVCV